MSYDHLRNRKGEALIPAAWDEEGPAGGEVLSAYRAVRARLDREIARLTGILHHRLACRPGCAHCCELTSVLPVEAAVIARALAGLAPAATAALGRGPCPLLTAAGRCAVYADRPFICRTHGLPVGYRTARAGTIEVTACDRNFPPAVPIREEEVLVMDPYTAELHRLSGLLARSRGAAGTRFRPPEGGRVALASLLASASSNAPAPPA